MKFEKLALISVAAFAFISIFALSILAQNTNSASFRSIYFLGQGVAVNPSNSQDISVVKIGVADLSVSISGTSTDVNIGILYFDDGKYVLKDITAGNATNSGNIYLNNSAVGSYSLNLISKPSVNIWAGTITLNGTTYNTYILEAQRTYTPAEESSSIADYCQGHASDTNCRLKLEQYCQTNPSDQRCIALLNNYCKSNLEDGRCRQELKSTCTSNPAAAGCADFCKAFPKACSPTNTAVSTSSTTTLTSSTASSSSTTMSETTSTTSAMATTSTTSATTTTTVASTSSTTTTTMA